MSEMLKVTQKATTTRMTWKASKPCTHGCGMLQWTSLTAAYWSMYSKGRNEWMIWEVLTKCNRTPPITQDSLCFYICTFILCNINMLITSGMALEHGVSTYLSLKLQTSSMRKDRSARVAWVTHFSTTLEANLCCDNTSTFPRTDKIICVLSSGFPCSVKPNINKLWNETLKFQKIVSEHKKTQ